MSVRKCVKVLATLVLAAGISTAADSVSPTSKENVLYSFSGGADGGLPVSSLIFDRVR